MQIKILNSKKALVKTIDFNFRGLKNLTTAAALKTIMEHSATPVPFYFEFNLKGLSFKKQYDEFPNKEMLIEDITSLKDELKNFRATTRTVEETQRTACNGAIRYKTTGGVFLVKDSIKTLIGPDFKMRLLESTKKPDNKIKRNYVGLELELCAMVNADELKKHLLEANLHRYVQVTNDGSVSPHKGGKAYEIRALVPEDEVATIVPKICETLTSKTVGGYVNSTCGFHVHMDCRNRDASVVYKNLVMGLPLLSSMVPPERISGVGGGRTHYCKQNTTGAFETAKESGDRYQAINPMSHNEHQTIEVRLHSGTLNAKKIVNWISVLATFANHKTALTKKMNTVTQFATINSNAELHKYMERRIKTFTCGAVIDTVMDENLDALIDSGALAKIVNF